MYTLIICTSHKLTQDVHSSNCKNMAASHLLIVVTCVAKDCEAQQGLFAVAHAEIQLVSTWLGISENMSSKIFCTLAQSTAS